MSRLEGKCKGKQGIFDRGRRYHFLSYSITSHPSSGISNMHSHQASSESTLPTLVTRFHASNRVFTSWVLGQTFERHYFHTSSHARLASFFILVFLFIATGILHCPSSLSSSLSSYLDTFTICAPYHDVPNL